jgi:hypothetical protein
MYIDVSARKVAWWVRLLAIFFVFCAAAAAYFTVSDLIRNGAQDEIQVVDIVLIAFISALFGNVAITGRPPVKWFRIAATKLSFVRK